MISANGGLPAHRYTPQVTQRWPRGSEPASANFRASLSILVQFYVHAQRPCLRVHRETIGVLKGVVECQRGTSNTLESPQCGLIGFGLYLGVGYCKGSGFV